MPNKQKGGEKIVKTLPERMIEYRARERISQKELADRCGISLQTVNSIENELQTPSKVTEAKINLVIEEQKKEEE